MSAVPLRGQKRALESLELELQEVVSCPTWVLGLNTGPLEQQQEVLTTESSLQPLL